MTKTLKSKIHHTYEEKLEIVSAICANYEDEQYTIDSCCNQEGISLRSFRYWCAAEPELNFLYREATKKRDLWYKQGLRQRAKTLLEKKLEGFEVEDTQTTFKEVKTGEIDENGKEITKIVPSQMVKTKKTIIADTALIIFVLSNTNIDNDDSFKRNDTQINQINQNNFQNNQHYNLDNVSTETLERLMLEMNNEQT